MPGISLKEIPTKVFNLILDKQVEETKKKGQKINKSQAVIMLIKEAYLKEKT
jgi:hypothetical protein